MKIALRLLLNDLKAAKSWFDNQTFSKLMITGAFVLILAGVFWLLYSASKFFFLTLTPLKTYGWLTADYILRAATLTIFWLGFGSSSAANLNVYYGANKNLNYLITLPVKMMDLVWWLFVKTIVINMAMLTIFLLPILLALATAFWGRPDAVYLLKVTGVITATAIMTNCGGAIAALIIPNWSGKRNYLTIIAAVIGFLILLMALIRLVFPSKLINLYQANNDQFFKIYNSLPLTSNLIPTNWLIAVITQESVVSIGETAILTGILVGGWVYLSQKKFLKRWQETTARTTAPETNHQISAVNWFVKNPLVLKDGLAITRAPGEIAYGTFLLTILALFFGLFSQIKIMEHVETKWLINLTMFSYLWLLFFVNTYLLRLVFPLTAKEAESAWYIFTLPIKREIILKAKLGSAGLLSLPLLFFSLAIWWILPSVTQAPLLLIASSTWAILILSLVHAFMGTINPNFSQGSNPERVSTSMMGLITLALASGLALILAGTIGMYLMGILTLTKVVLIHAVVSIGFILPIYLVAKSSLKQYQF